MAPDLTFDVARTAVLAMDCQSGIVSIYVKPQEEFVDRASRVLRVARNAGMLVVLVQVGFRPGLPEVSERNKLLGAIKASPEHQKLFQGPAGAIHPAVGPEPSDIVITKHRVSAFTGTDLDMILRAREIETVVLFGIATSGVVLSTLLHASDSDYKLAVVADCCADMDAELHGALITRLFPKRAEVLNADEFGACLERAFRKPG
jgi:nicotinamidase-related amidase